MTIQEPGRELKVVGDYDVVVVGAGIAGCSAAVAAARVRGTKVCVLENYCLPGGLATIGNVVVYLPLCDGKGRQVCGGLAETQLRMSVAGEQQNEPAAGIDLVPECWNKGGDVEERAKRRYRASFNPMKFALALEQQLRGRHVKLFYGVRFAGVIKDGRDIKAVVVETKEGRVAIRCRAVVDASGDGDVCQAAGEKMASFSNNVACGWFYARNKGQVKNYRESDPILIPGEPRKKGVPVYKFDMAGISSQIIASHDKLRSRMAAVEAAEGEEPFLLNVPTFPTFRMSRRLAGKVVLKPSDEHRWFEDTIGMTGDWRKAGPIYCIPFRAIIGVETNNLAVAGRCISSTGDTWDVTRVIPPCAVTGEAAGAAAAILAGDSNLTSFKEMDIPGLQSYLRKNKVIIDRALLK